MKMTNILKRLEHKRHSFSVSKLKFYFVTFLLSTFYLNSFSQIIKIFFKPLLLTGNFPLLGFSSQRQRLFTTLDLHLQLFSSLKIADIYAGRFEKYRKLFMYLGCSGQSPATKWQYFPDPSFTISKCFSMMSFHWQRNFSNHI